MSPSDTTEFCREEKLHFAAVPFVSCSKGEVREIPYQVAIGGKADSTLTSQFGCSRPLSTYAAGNFLQRKLTVRRQSEHFGCPMSRRRRRRSRPTLCGRFAFHRQ